MRFYDWVKERKITDNPRGDAIEDILRDWSFPRGIVAYEDVISHLHQRNACREAVRSVKSLWKEFQKEINK